MLTRSGGWRSHHHLHVSDVCGRACVWPTNAERCGTAADCMKSQSDVGRHCKSHQHVCVCVFACVCWCISNYGFLANHNECVTVLTHECVCVYACVCVMGAKLKGSSHTTPSLWVQNVRLRTSSFRSRLMFRDEVCGSAFSMNWLRSGQVRVRDGVMVRGSVWLQKRSRRCSKDPTKIAQMCLCLKSYS